MSFYKRVMDNIDEKFKKYLPESESHFNECILQHKDAASPDALLITERLNQKVTPAEMKAFLDGDEGGHELQARGLALKEVFLECVLDRSRKSLEHLKRFVELFYNEIFKPWFVTCTGETKRDSQTAVVRMVVSMW